MNFWEASVYRALHRWSGLTTISIGGALEGFHKALQSPPEFFPAFTQSRKVFFLGQRFVLSRMVGLF